MVVKVLLLGRKKIYLWHIVGKCVMIVDVQEPIVGLPRTRALRRRGLVRRDSHAVARDGKIVLAACLSAFAGGLLLEVRVALDLASVHAKRGTQRAMSIFLLLSFNGRSPKGSNRMMLGSEHKTFVTSKQRTQRADLHAAARHNVELRALQLLWTTR